MRSFRVKAVRSFFVFTIPVLTAALTVNGSTPVSCERLRGLKLPNTTIKLAQLESAGAFLPPQPNLAPRDIDRYKRLPAFCRVVADLTPSADSHIEIEVWMPASHWNRKFQGQGNGGFAGAIGYNSMSGALESGYATAGNDTGHKAEGTDAAWALGHPEKIIDFGYRAIHEMTGKAKLIIGAYYEDRARESYFASCSDGGREALMEAQRFPADYDGILAGAPANYWTHLVSNGSGLAVEISNPRNYIPPAKIPALSSAVLAACDAQDGVKDGFLSDPRRCHFDPAVLLCGGAESDACLTSPQVATLKKIYAGTRTSHGEQIFPGYLPGGEEGPGGWKDWILGSAAGESAGEKYVNGYFRFMVYDNPQWTLGSTSLDENVQTADEKTAAALNATDADLSAFQKRGGKLILYHGWNDPAISALNTVNYYGRVVSKMGQDQADGFLRLYMIPGMQHCSGGPGPSSFGQFSGAPRQDPEHNMLTTLERWQESGTVPGTVIATKYAGDDSSRAAVMTRPLCAYPQVATYKGSGDTNNSANFTCENAGR